MKDKKILRKDGNMILQIQRRPDIGMPIWKYMKKYLSVAVRPFHGSLYRPTTNGTEIILLQRKL